MAALDEKVAKDPELDEDSDDDEDEMPVRKPGSWRRVLPQESGLTSSPLAPGPASELHMWGFG